MKNELFILSPAALHTLDADEVKATVEALQELGLYNLPYPKIDVMIPCVLDVSKGRMLVGMDDGGLDLTFQGLQVDGTVDTIHISKSTTHYLKADTITLRQPDVMFANVKPAAAFAAKALIVLLATRNIEKQTSVNKLARLGIGPKTGRKSYPRVTTINCPVRPPADDSAPHTAGAPKAPHLRRGHIRSQHYGPNMALRKQVWIAPVIVNADRSFVESRTRYNVSFHAPSTSEKVK